MEMNEGLEIHKLAGFIWLMSDREGQGHKAVLYKSHFPATKAFKHLLLERHHCIHRLINHVYK